MHQVFKWPFKISQPIGNQQKKFSNNPRLKINPKDWEPMSMMFFKLYQNRYIRYIKFHFLWNILKVYSDFSISVQATSPSGYRQQH